MSATHEQTAPAPPAFDELPASFGQERLWFFQRFEPGNAVYNATLALRLRGPLDIATLEGALSAIAARHESLRTTFARVDGRLVQRVALSAELPVEVVDVTCEHAPFDAAKREARRHAERPFDLEHGPLARGVTFRLDDEDHVLLVVIHHIVSDGWSMGILMRELAELYAAGAEGRSPILPELPLQYGDFAAWQREWLDAQAEHDLLAYWRDRLDGAPLVLDLPTDRPRPPALSYRGENLYFDLPNELRAATADFTAAHDTTLFVALLSAFYGLVHRYTSVDDLVVATPVTGRPHAEVEGLIGFFVNTLALRVRVDDDPTFAQLVARTREVVLDAIVHQDLPFERLVDELQPARDLSATPLVQVMFALQNAPTEVVRLGPLVGEPFSVEPGTVPFDLLVEVIDTGERLIAQVGFATDLFERTTVERMMRSYATLLEAAIAEPHVPLSRLDVLSAEERRLVIEVWNSTDQGHETTPVHVLVELHASEQPDAPAVSAPDGAVTYRELDERATTLARHLVDLGTCRGEFVCVYVEPGAAAVIAMLAVLKSGGAYVSLDADLPPDRMRYIVEQTGTKVVLTQTSLAVAVPPGPASVLLDRDLPASDAVLPTTTVDDAAYVIYTSGSTGRPKGVVVTHGNLLNLVHWHRHRFGTTPADRMGQTARLGFDASVWEVWSALAWGASLHVADRATRVQPRALRDWMVRERLTFAQVATLLAERLIVLDWPEGTALRRLACGGEKLVGRPRPGQPFSLHDMYGPTECAVISVSDEVAPRTSDHTALPPIGRPIDNTRVYIVDRHGEPLPVGAVGEIRIGGYGVSTGYLAAPALTASAFVPDPFDPRPGRRLYCTGDRGRFLPDGSIEMRGRADDQVKVRGFRVELGEVQRVLEHDPLVADAVVVAAGEGRDRRLVAYVVPAGAPEVVFEPTALRTSLRKVLPEYMVPAIFVPMRELPTGTNGKVDRDALPPPPIAPERRDVVAPRTATEERVAAVWREVLGFSAVGITDKFFDLGGNSLGIVDVHERLDALFPGLLTVADLFEHVTVEAIAVAIDGCAEPSTASGFEL